MRQSHLFSKTTAQTPHGASSANHRLLVMGGFIDQLMAGVYSFLPLGWRVFERINTIIREELNALGAQELHMPALTPKSVWTPTGRWTSAKDVMFQFADASGNEYALGWTHEEVITHIAKRFISSYRDLPLAVYQIQDKFRNEARAKSGLIRGREFSMKDLYSFHESEEDLESFYGKVLKAYTAIFSRCGLETKIVEASGGEFTKQYSHEFQVLSEAGEDTIVYDPHSAWAQNRELFFEEHSKLEKDGVEMKEAKSIEVGNTFKLGTRFSAAEKLTFQSREGESTPVIMASYGIGPGRIMGTVVEVHHDDRGILWPASIAPFAAHLLMLGKEEETRAAADALYATLQQAGVEVLYDDRQGATAGEKLHDADLLGMPVRLVVSAKTIAKEKVEWKERSGGEPSLLSEEELLKRLTTP